MEKRNNTPLLDEFILNKGYVISWDNHLPHRIYPLYSLYNDTSKVGLGKTQFEWTNMESYTSYYQDEAPLEYPLNKLPGMLGLSSKANYEWTDMKNLFKPFVQKSSLANFMYSFPFSLEDDLDNEPTTNESWMEQESYNLDLLFQDNNFENNESHEIPELNQDIY